MPKFTFRLQPVLNIRNQQEENLKNEMGKAIQKLEAEKQKLRSLEEKENQIVDEFNKKTQKTAVKSLLQFNDYIGFLKSQIISQKENVNKAAVNVDKVREELVKAVKNRKIMDKLKDKKKEEYVQEEKKLEHKANDEIVSYDYKDGLTGE
jgi:flagellar FliJ protein